MKGTESTFVLLYFLCKYLVALNRGLRAWQTSEREDSALCFTSGETLLFVSDIHYSFLVTFGNNNILFFNFIFISFFCERPSLV